MAITVRFVGSLRSSASKGKLAISMKDDVVSLREFIKRIVENRPRLKRALIDPELEDPRLNYYESVCC